MSTRRTRTNQKAFNNGVRGSINITTEFSVSGDDRESPVSPPTAPPPCGRSLRGAPRQNPPSQIRVPVLCHRDDPQDRNAARDSLATPLPPHNDLVASSSSSPASSASFQSRASTQPSPRSSAPTSPQVQHFPTSNGKLKGKDPKLQPSLEPLLRSDGGVSFDIPQNMFEVIYRDGKAWGVFHPIVECNRLANELKDEREKREIAEREVGGLQQELEKAKAGNELLRGELEEARRKIKAKEDEMKKLADRTEQVDQDLKKQRDRNKWYDRFLVEIKRLQGEPKEISDTLLELLREGEEKSYNLHEQPETENDGSKEPVDPSRASLEPQLTQTNLMVMSIEPVEQHQDVVDNDQAARLQERIDQLRQENEKLGTRQQQTELELQHALQRHDKKDEEVTRLNGQLVESSHQITQAELDADVANQRVGNLRTDLPQERKTILEKNATVALLSGLLAGVMANLNEGHERRQRLQQDLAKSQSGEQDLRNLLTGAESRLARVEEEILAAIKELQERIKKPKHRLNSSRRHRHRRHRERPGKSKRYEVVRGRSGRLSVHVTGSRRRS